MVVFFVGKTRTFKFRFSGYAVEVWRTLEKGLNFSSQVQVAKSFGKEQADGTWNGMVVFCPYLL